jgi:hypothetical protein
VTVVRRLPLTQGDRRELSEQIRRGNASSNLPSPDVSPYELLGCPAAGSRGLVYFNETIADGEGLEPDDARQLAQALLMLADHCEFGPGEWTDGEWRQIWRDR